MARFVILALLGVLLPLSCGLIGGDDTADQIRPTTTIPVFQAPTPTPTPTPRPTPTPTPAPPTPTPAPPTLTPTPVTEVIASEDWESGGFSGGSGWLSAWTVQEGSDAVVTTQNTPFAGVNHLRLRSSDGYVSRDVNLSGKSGVHLSFYAKVQSFEGSDTATAQVSPDGTNWTTVKTWTGGRLGQRLQACGHRPEWLLDDLSVLYRL